jgi:glycosyltransferase involved in cell wall biosynthesis
VATKKSSPSEAVGSPEIALVFAYYDNPSMLEFQWKQIAGYSSAVRRRIEVIVVDDASPHSPAISVPRPKSLPDHRVYRIAHDIPWNQDAARNIGAHEAKAPWLLLTDIDHVVPEGTLQGLLAMKKDSKVFYTLGRTKFFTADVREPHPNSYVMTRDMYWAIGGHDEDYAGIYGKDYLFRKRALKYTREVHRSDFTLARVGTSNIPDAGTRTITRRNTRLATLRGYVLQGLKAMRLMRGVQTLKAKYSQVV